TLRVDGVEGERTLARAGQPRNHRQGIPRDRDRDVPQVVLPRTAHLNVSEAHRRALADYGHLPRIQAAGELPFQAVRLRMERCARSFSRTRSHTDVLTLSGNRERQ